MELSAVLPQEQLKQARLDARWSIEKVAKALNLPTRSISLLETGDFSRLHGSIYVVSYIKAYAALFSLDADALIDQYHQLSQQPSNINDAPAMESQLHQSLEMLRDERSSALISIAVAVLLLLLVVGSWLLPDNASVVSQAHQLHLDTVAGTMVIESLDDLPNQSPTADILPSVNTTSIAAKLDKQVLIKNRVFNTQNQVMLETNSTLQFSFSADCWVEVFDGDNQKIYASLQKSQENLQLSGKPPFRITLGYAPGVSLSYNGQPVNIDAGKAKLTKLILGKS